MSIQNDQEIVTFYNHFANQQIQVGQNERHHSIINYLIKSGLQKHHQVLEIGCGIGTLTDLISKYLNKTGHITALDISDENIRVAKDKYLTSTNIEWICLNVLTFNSSRKFDFIVLPDVLEHIPIDHYEILFKKLKSLLKETGLIFIHIPSPFYIDWLKLNYPEQLQIIDQPVYTENIIGYLIQNDLYIYHLNYYKIWCDPEDYKVIIIKNKPDREKNNFIEPDFDFNILTKFMNKVKAIFY